MIACTGASVLSRSSMDSLLRPKWNRSMQHQIAKRVSKKCVMKPPRLERITTVLLAKAESDFEVPEELSNTTYWDNVFARDIMTPDPLTVTPETSVFAALQTLDSMQISSLPVIDETHAVLGVVSAFDILVLDSTPGHIDRSDGYFPPVDKCKTDFGGDRKAMWLAFLNLRKEIEKAQATKVGESMHDAFCMSECATLSELADQIIMKHLHRIFIVNENDKLVGVVSRGDILRITMGKYREVKESG
eukprot:g4549.t1